MNRYSLSKYLLIVVILAMSLIYATPNLYTPDPAIQISGQSSSQIIDQAVLDKAERALKKAGINYFGGEASGKNGLLRLTSQDQQLPARRVVSATLGENYVVALNKAATTPAWLQSIGANPMKLGLDLSGGVHFLLQVDTNARIQQDMDTRFDLVKNQLRENKIRSKSIKLSADNIIVINFKDAESRDAARSMVRSKFRELVVLPEESSFGRELINADTPNLRLQLSEPEIKSLIDSAVQQNLVSLKNRVNELGVSEPIVQRQGKNRIVVELPGVQDPAEAKRIIGKTATLEFRLAANSKSVRAEAFEYKNPKSGQPPKAELERKAVISGEHVTNAKVGYDENGMPQVNINLSSEGGSLMHRSTWKNVGRGLGVLFVEQKSRLIERTTESGEVVLDVKTKEDKKIISLATIQSALGVQFRITGLDSPTEAQELALLLRAGALAAPMVFVEERTIGPSLGAENIKLGIKSVIIGLTMVVLFMLVYYKVFGVFATLALTANLMILVAVMSLLGATLTLPGIAGIVLTVGMAVDANVLIFSRIKEELANGLPPQSAISAGYDRAFVSIIDANITTLIVALILFMIGSGPVQGFAVTLSIGILTSMFTAIMGTRALVNLTMGGRKITKLWI
jgi:preprotein translocase subunit SecD